MDYAAARHNMVESQLRTNKVIDERIVAAMSRVARESFLPDALRSIAYVDEDIPLGGDRFLIEPMVFARLAQYAQLSPGERVLLVGAGCGYGAAILAAAGATVFALESDSRFAAAAKIALSRNAISGANVVEGPLEAGWPSGAPYDAIVFEGATGRLPASFAGQLAEGGRIVGIVAQPGQPGRATVWRKFGGSLTSRIVFDAGTPMLPGLALEPGFVF
ncbi:MAG: protein-L-isoaspartate O-methyltransferase [Rhodospirillales bacterium]|nr:protein-L-isoaspartate O-methyltransferase [Rhodospirillales bacterium]